MVNHETVVSFVLIARNLDTNTLIVGVRWEVPLVDMRKIIADECARLVELIGHVRIDFDVRMITA